MQELLPPELQVFLMSMFPAVELRGSIPYGMTLMGLSAWTSLGISLIGNCLIAFVLLWLLDPVTQFLRKHIPIMKRFTDWLFEKTRHKHSQRMSDLGHLALFVFVAIPLPGSGAWSGSLVAYLFDVKKSTALMWINAGVIVAGLLITFGTAGIMNLAQWVLAG